MPVPAPTPPHPRIVIECRGTGPVTAKPGSSVPYSKYRSAQGRNWKHAPDDQLQDITLVEQNSAPHARWSSNAYDFTVVSIIGNSPSPLRHTVSPFSPEPRRSSGSYAPRGSTLSRYCSTGTSWYWAMGRVEHLEAGLDSCAFSWMKAFWVGRVDVGLILHLYIGNVYVTYNGSSWPL